MPHTLLELILKFNQVSELLGADPNNKDLLKKLSTEVEEYAKVEVAPKFEGKQIMMILVPQVAK